MSFLLILQIFVQVIPDFQVNSEDYASKAIQWFPAITNYDSGGVAVWHDMRMPNNGMRVFGVRLNASGDTIGTNFIINDDTTTGCLSYPDVDCDFQGNFTTVWVQNSNTNCRRFLNDGTPIGASFVVNNVSGSCYGPSISVDSSGRTVVTWSDNHEYNEHRIYGQIYDDTGNPVGTNFPISDSSQTTPMISDVSLSSKKEFIAVWVFNYDIWCQRLDSLGNKIGGNFKVWEDTINIGESYSRIKHTKDGKFLVAWSTSGQGNIYCRLFDSTAMPMSDVIKLNDSQLTYSWHPKVANFQDSLWFIVWEDSFSNVSLQRISSEGILLGNNIQINEPVGEWNRYPDVGVSDDHIIITWSRRITYFVWDIMIQEISPDGNLIGQNRIITDDKGGAPQYFPSVVVDTTGDFFIVWDDPRDPEYNCLSQYGRRFDPSGNPLCEDFRINENIDAAYAAIGLNNLGLYVTVWARTDPDSNRQIYGQRFDRNGVPLGPNFQISQAPGNFAVEFPRISSLTDNKFIVVWSDHRVYPMKVHGRILDPLGIPQGDEFTAFIDSTANNSLWSIVDGRNSKFILGMCCDKDSIAIAIQEFDYEANPLSAPIILNEIPGGYIPAGAKGLNRYLFVWSDFSWAKIYGQFLNDSLQNIGNNFLVSDDTTNYKTFPCVVSNQGGQFFTLWQQGNYEYEDIYGQFFDSLGNKIGDNFKVDNDTTNSSQWMPSCYSKNNLIYIVWSDARYPTHNYDIYCKVIEWTQTGICEHNLATFQNFITLMPNPFRNKLNIKFRKGHPDRITRSSYGTGSAEGIELKIYDVSGRIIRSFNLASGLVPLASTVSWDGKDDLGNRIAAGVYFIKLNYESDNVIKKVVKIK
ncbi:T9SS type A sorting domain-containing protein [candidate division WOR-3 bacterium]|nr:T9SS type A sorting domain-containing protein [candidate division WOR-3 bacterium]